MINDKSVQINELKTLLDYYSQFKNWAEFIEMFFKIKDKDTGALIPFKLSNIQRKTFNTLLQQYNREKKVDAIIIKGRRSKQSSLISALACCYAIFNQSKNLYLVADLLDNAKKILKNYHNLFFDSDIIRNILSVAFGVRPKQTIFCSTESVNLCNGSSFKLASMIGASQGDRASIGAGDMISFFHGTEFFGEWEAVSRTFLAMTGINTFKIIESTPRPNCAIHDVYNKAISSQYSKTVVIFYSWWDDEDNVASKIDINFDLNNFFPSQEILDYANSYNSNLTKDQMGFMALKLEELKSIKIFNEEYPATPELAFMQDTTGFYFEPQVIAKSMRSEIGIYQNHDINLYPIIVGIDPAYTGKDKCAIVIRQGMWVHEIITLEGLDTMAIFSEVWKLYQHYSRNNKAISKIFIDKTGSDGLVSVLRENLGFNIVKGISFGEKPINDAKYVNKGAEMIDHVKDAMNGGLSIPDNKNLRIQLSNMKFEYNIKSQLKREPKEELKKRIGMSPDELDALALTFAYHVPMETNMLDNYNNHYVNQKDELEQYRDKVFGI